MNSSQESVIFTSSGHSNDECKSLESLCCEEQEDVIKIITMSMPKVKLLQQLKNNFYQSLRDLKSGKGLAPVELSLKKFKKKS